MAKAKKSESTDAPAPKKRATKSNKKSEKSESPAAASAMPLIDTHLAAQNAAQLIAHRNLLKNATSGGSDPLLQQIKQSANQPHAASLSNLLDSTAAAGQKKSSQPFAHKEVGHNQTFGADVNRHNIPRRTSGG